MANAYLVGIYNKVIDQEKLQKYVVEIGRASCREKV